MFSPIPQALLKEPMVCINGVSERPSPIVYLSLGVSNGLWLGRPSVIISWPVIRKISAYCVYFRNGPIFWDS
jgi:hypothetical protein